jgi:hypothetical protein
MTRNGALLLYYPFSRSYRPMASKTPDTMAMTAIPVLKYAKLKLISGMSPVKMSHTASNNTPMFLFMVSLL